MAGAGGSCCSLSPPSRALSVSPSLKLFIPASLADLPRRTALIRGTSLHSDFTGGRSRPRESESVRFFVF